jgi:hypothetical protein
MRRGAAERTADRTPDARFDGTWALRDSDAWYEIEVGVAGSTKIRCCDPQESFAVSDIAWRDGELCFVTLCPSTQWRIENRLLRIDGETLLVVRRGDSYEPTTARRQRRASAREGMQNER